MRRLIANLILPFALLSPGLASAQDAVTADAATSPLPQAERLPDIELLAHVTADSVEFHEDPQVSVNFPGTPGRKNVWHAVRTNLPGKIEVGHVYENVVVDLVISTTLPAQPSKDDVPPRSPR